MKKQHVLVLLGFAAVIGCSEGLEGPEPGPPTIRESYNAIAIHYNAGSIDGVKAFYSRSFRHDGMTASDLDSIWTYRIAGGTVKIRGFAEQTIFAGDSALSTVEVFFINSGVNDTIHIGPGEDFDDMCYWRKEADYWKLLGNQQ
jgi:hypothetical protein